VGLHYIPQHYLRGFSDVKDTDRIWQYGRGDATGKLLPIRIVAQSKRLYNLSTERYLADQVERPANPLLDVVRCHHAIPGPEEKRILGRYIAHILTRVPSHLREVEAAIPAIRQGVYEEIKGVLSRVALVDPARAQDLSIQYQQTMELWVSSAKGVPDDLYFDIVRPRALPGVARVLSGMRWTFLVGAGSQPLLTSDRPLYFDARKGLGAPNATFWFPIDSHTLLMGHNDLAIAERFWHVRGEMFCEMNRRIAYTADRFVYGSEQQDWLLKVLAKPRDLTSTVRFPRVS